MLPAPLQRQQGWSYSHAQTLYLTECLLGGWPLGGGATVGWYAPKTKSSCSQPSSFSVQTSSLESAPRGGVSAETPAPLLLLLLPCSSHWECCLWENTAGNISPGNPQANCLLGGAHSERRRSYGHCADAPRLPRGQRTALRHQAPFVALAKSPLAAPLAAAERMFPLQGQQESTPLSQASAASSAARLCAPGCAHLAALGTCEPV